MAAECMAAANRERLPDGTMEECGPAVFEMGLVSEGPVRFYCSHHALKFIHMTLDARTKGRGPP